MRFLVVGLGSMGKRRIRNLQTLDGHQIAGYDLREDRLEESRSKYKIDVYPDFHDAIQDFNPDALIISTSPEHHMHYANVAFQRGMSCFIEASVVDAEGILSLQDRCKAQNNIILIAPSCTMRYFPGPKKVKELLNQGIIGRPLNVNYHVGQYLPDWHPWESIEDYYVSVKETGGAREIVPFELTWINDLLGQPTPLACKKTKLSDLDADIDDIYHCILSYPNEVLVNMTVEVISRPQATRELRILGTEGEIVFSADENRVRFINTQKQDWTCFELSNGSVECGYINPEEPYIDEMRDFILALTHQNPQLFPNTLHDDYIVLQTLYGLEALSEKI